MHFYKKLFQLLAVFICILLYSQVNIKDTLRGEFTYLLKAKLNNSYPNQIDEEYFSLQIVNKKAFFISIKSLKKDSLMDIVSKNANTGGGTTVYDLRGMSVPNTKFPYTIIQSSENIQYFRRIVMSLLTYKEPIINDWTLINDLKIINSMKCKKATVNYKERSWIAWYSGEIPLPYGPYKFSGLPGLIIKITDEKGDFDFELVKAKSNTELKGKLFSINKNHYTEAVETTQSKLERALEDANDNAFAVSANFETTIIQGQEIIKQKQKQRELDKKDKNRIELND